MRSGREWLWTSDRIPLAQQSYGVSYIERGDSGGWDECFPTVAACAYPLEPHRGESLPDHGDLWSQAWTVEARHHQDRIQIDASCRARRLPCQFTRSITLLPGSARLVMDYEVQSLGTYDIAFIWSAHPLFRIEPGMRLRFPSEARFHLYSATPTTQLPGTEPLAWPFPVHSGAREFSLAALPGRDANIAFKVWSDPLDEGWASLSADDGELHMQFDANALPQVAFWLNAGGWSGIGGDPYYNLALEPCIGAQDSLEEAVTKYSRYGLLRAGESKRWSLSVELRSGSN